MTSTLDKYQFRMNRKYNNEKLPENEIRIASNASPSRAIARAANLFFEKKFERVILLATGNAISTLCVTSEIIKRRIKGLHSIAILTNTEITDEYEPKEEGLDVVVIQRKLSVLKIILAKNPTEEEKKHPGYQIPLPENEVEEINLADLKRGGGRGRGRGVFRKRGRQLQPRRRLSEDRNLGNTRGKNDFRVGFRGRGGRFRDRGQIRGRGGFRAMRVQTRGFRMRGGERGGRARISSPRSGTPTRNKSFERGQNVNRRRTGGGFNMRRGGRGDRRGQRRLSEGRSLSPTFYKPASRGQVQRRAVRRGYNKKY